MLSPAGWRILSRGEEITIGRRGTPSKNIFSNLLHVSVLRIITCGSNSLTMMRRLGWWATKGTWRCITLWDNLQGGFLMGDVISEQSHLEYLKKFMVNGRIAGEMWRYQVFCFHYLAKIEWLEHFGDRSTNRWLISRRDNSSYWIKLFLYVFFSGEPSFYSSQRF